MKKHNLLALTLFILVLNSCSKSKSFNQKEVFDAESISDEILSFKTSAAFIHQLEALDKMDYETMIKWKENNSRNSYYDLLQSLPKNSEINFDKLGIRDLPPSYQILLNKNGLVRIADTLYLYSNGNKFHIPQTELFQLSDIGNLNLDKYNKSKYYIETYYLDKSADLTNRINIGVNNNNDARYQWEFNQQSTTQGSGCRKFVNELRTIRDQWDYFPGTGCGPGYTFFVSIHYVLKMEWRNCRKNNWQPAGERRNFRWNLNYTLSLRGVSLPCSTISEYVYTYSGTKTSPPFQVPLIEEGITQTGDYWIGLGSVSGNTKSSNTNLYWELDLSGFAYQRVINDLATNAWTNSGAPLF